ncbi:hypothetical protein IV203_024297 [Nitzschia inconspicua]|uniref:Uncharacterized protein n=1 Tax=Nitzschia inconspicua TaxID=303405 RepID=A0A9K3PD61_9STRA|nr:hypothetical protein IV203_024297 [Nitzschia inconspicua]
MIAWTSDIDRTCIGHRLLIENLNFFRSEQRLSLSRVGAWHKNIVEKQAFRPSVRTDSDTVIETYIDDTGVTQEIRDQLSEYVATKKSKQNWQSYWYKLRKAYLNEFENLDPARNAPGPSPVAYPRPTLRFEGDTKGSEEDDNSAPKPRPRKQKEEEEEAVVVDHSTQVEASSFGNMSVVQSGLCRLKQTSKSGIALANKAMVWQDCDLNWHVQVLAWLPSGADASNLKASCNLKTLSLTFPTAEMLYASEPFEQAYDHYMKQRGIIGGGDTIMIPLCFM